MIEWIDCPKGGHKIKETASLSYLHGLWFGTRWSYIFENYEYAHVGVDRKEDKIIINLVKDLSEVKNQSSIVLLRKNIREFRRFPFPGRGRRTTKSDLMSVYVGPNRLGKAIFSMLSLKIAKKYNPCITWDEKERTLTLSVDRSNE